MIKVNITMIETIWMIEPWHWLVLGFLLMIAEIFIPTFASLWFGAAAVIVAGLAWLLPIPIMAQVLVWLALSVVFMFAWIKFIKPLSINRKKAAQSNSTIIGETGMIIVKPQTDTVGMIRFNVPIFGADEWTCRTEGAAVEVGDRVLVTAIRGDELIVAPTQRIAAPVDSIQPNITPELTANVEARAAKEKVSNSRLNLNKPNLDSVRLNNKFTNK